MDCTLEVEPRLKSQELRSIYHTYGGLMLRRCQQNTKDPHLADDAFQDSFMNLIRYGSGYRKVEHKQGWLYTLCDRACFSRLKKKKARGQEDEAIDLADNSPQVSLRLEHRETVSALWGVLEEDERDIAVMYYVHGFTQAKIAGVMRLSRQTINKKLTKIKAKAQALSHSEVQAHC